MHKLLLAVPVLALLTVSVTGVQAQHIPDLHGLDKSFQRMDKKMDEAQKAQGEERQHHMHQHMQMMRDQMQAMHGMMGRGLPDISMGPGQHMGRGAHRPRGQIASGANQWMQDMQTRMDFMQRMMEQMHKQHELMLKNETEEKK